MEFEAATASLAPSPDEAIAHQTKIGALFETQVAPELVDV